MLPDWPAPVRKVGRGGIGVPRQTMAADSVVGGGEAEAAAPGLHSGGSGGAR